jgi:hypothetical protein
MDRITAIFLWRRLEEPGHDTCRLFCCDDGWRLEGAAVFRAAAGPCCLQYRVLADNRFHTRRATVTGYLGRRAVDLRVAASGRPGARRWRLNGEPVPGVGGCVDVDLGFTPATNLLPIRRLALRIGEAADAPAAYLSFPGLRFRPLAQRYRRVGRDAYAYESPEFGYAATLRVDRHGAVADYPGLFELEPVQGVR